MEHIHGIDVSWMTHGSSKDSKAPKPTSRRRNTLQSQPAPPTPTTPQATATASVGSSPQGSPRNGSPAPMPIAIANGNANAENVPLSASLPTNANGGRSRRPSWFSNISSKFSTNPGSNPAQATAASPKQAELSVPRAGPAKNAILQHGTKHEGESPYTPAPVKGQGQSGGLLHVFRRLSSSGNNAYSRPNRNHGIVERRVLNVNYDRERCKLAELSQGKLRRVAFCVDVEIAPMPKYKDDDAALTKTTTNPAAATPALLEKGLKAADKGEGAALKAAKAAPADGVAAPAAKPADIPGVAAPPTTPTAPTVPTAPTAPAAPATPSPAASASPPKTNGTDANPSSSPTAGGPTADVNRKKEKKKRSEEERKARKEKKRQLAEANGTLPMEIYLDDESDADAAQKRAASKKLAAPRAQLSPTTNPARIYRRCCQLRETPILRKITEQLSDPAMFSPETGIVSKLDLTGYWLNTNDLTTLGDFLAVVPIREVIFENCGLGDEGLRVILAGLLAARKPQKRHLHLRHYSHKSHQGGGGPCDKSSTVPVTASNSIGQSDQGGFVERLVLKNNKIGVEGWKNICLFVYMCRSLKILDLSSVVFPHTLVSKPSIHPPNPLGGPMKAELAYPYDVCQLFAKSLGERLGGSTLELLNIGDTGLSAVQLGWIVDGLIQSGTRRLGLAHNDLDDAGVQHVARYLSSGTCEGLDLGGNDLRDRIEAIADAAATDEALWALSLADCNLAPMPLCKLMPKLAGLPNFKFLDLSHNHELFEAKPSATALLRRYLPLMESLKRLHLADCGMTSEQAIALAEIIPEIKDLAHLNILQNPLLTKLADARTEETQEQACALYASFLAATRLSSSIVVIDMAVPTPESTEIVRAMAKQVLAYCLRNVDRVTLGNTAASILGADASTVLPTAMEAASGATATDGSKGDAEYSDVIQHLVGHDAATLDSDEDIEAAPDDDYVIGGTGVAQALECCLKNRKPEQSGSGDGSALDGEYLSLVEGGGALLPGPKAKDMSKHLLQSARKIRLRLQPALQRAQALSAVDGAAYQRLLFLDNTLDGIIKRFEDEFPDTRVSLDSGVSVSAPALAAVEGEAEAEGDAVAESGASEVEAEAEAEGEAAAVFASDGEDETDILPWRLSRSNSEMSLSSKGLTNEEGRVLRAGHRFRSGWFKHYNLLSGVEEISSDPAHNRLLYDLVSEMHDAELDAKLAAKGIVRLFKEDREHLLRVLKEQDPEHWDKFVESQEKARANVKVEVGEGSASGVAGVAGVAAASPTTLAAPELSSSMSMSSMSSAAAAANEEAVIDD